MRVQQKLSHRRKPDSISHIQILVARNAMLSMHNVERALDSLDRFDPTAQELFNSQSSNYERISQ